MRRGLPLLAAVAAGVLLFCALPPVGWWPAGPLGLAGWAALTAGQSPGRRALVGWLVGIGLFAPGWWWMTGFTGPGYPVAVLAEAGFYAGAGLVTPSRRGRIAGFAAAVAGAGIARDHWPFGGVPIAGVALGQAGGPLLALARLGGVPLVTGATALAGAALAALATGAVRQVASRPDRAPDSGLRVMAAGAVALAVVAGLTAVAAAAPDGGAGRGRIRVALVQGGGPRGLRAVNRDPSLVFRAQVDAMAAVRQPVDLVLWPENVIELDQPLAGSPEDAEMAALAASYGATVAAGVTEPAGPDGFLNEAFAWWPDGTRTGPYTKVHRVPFGEWIPFRSVISHLGDVSAVPRDEVAGRGPGVLATGAGRVGVMISYEVFFDDRALAAVRAGGRVLLVPTNAASYTTSQMPLMEVAASRLRAVEAGRDLAQAAPTGYTALFDHRGRVLARSGLGARQVLQGVLRRRDGRTVFDRVGQAGPDALVGMVLLAAWAAAGRQRVLRRRRERALPPPAPTATAAG
ncbi:MAG TPA: apolipoprotein N-acyltransferase [Acidimicrobiales bacterium]|nr:apolipoprotein N-acyltransferase [Acidimicrobiales bacterium]